MLRILDYSPGPRQNHILFPLGIVSELQTYIQRLLPTPVVSLLVFPIFMNDTIFNQVTKQNHEKSPLMTLLSCLPQPSPSLTQFISFLSYFYCLYPGSCLFFSHLDYYICLLIYFSVSS